MSTRRWPAIQALRTRVSISATGSMTLIACPLPAGFAHAGDFPAQRKLTETDAAQFELAERAAAPAAALTPVVAPHLEHVPPLHPLHRPRAGAQRRAPVTKLISSRWILSSLP